MPMLPVASHFVGVEAAHIKWHQAGGPDTSPNGIALCALHHKLFDRGMITFSEDHRVLVSENATHVTWHVREVFREPARALESA
jgi:predicted restriction endonuclease